MDMQPVSFDYQDFVVTTDKFLMHPGDIYQWLSTKAYWYPNLAFDTFQSAFHHSCGIGALKDDRQIAYGRLITDFATFGYLADVYVEEAYRGKGLGKMMMQTLFDLEWVKGLRRIHLRTKDAFELYKKYGFKAAQFPGRIMGRGKIESSALPSQTTSVIHAKGEPFTCTTDKQLMDVAAIHRWLSGASYWAKHIPLATVQRAIDHSYCVGILSGDCQAGFARLATDYTTVGYLADVYVLEPYRGRGLAKMMLEHLLNRDWVNNLNINLVTKDSHGLYEKFGFTVCNPERFMELVRPDIYG